jgi:hypothetical protein
MKKIVVQQGAGDVSFFFQCVDLLTRYCTKSHGVLTAPCLHIPKSPLNYIVLDAERRRSVLPDAAAAAAVITAAAGAKC